MLLGKAASAIGGWAVNSGFAATAGARAMAASKQAAAASAQFVKTQGSKALASFSRPAPAAQSIAKAQSMGKSAATACSFSGVTVVLMANGTHKAIQDIQIGDKVIASDPETGEQAAKAVEQVFVHDDTVFDLVIDGEIISTTEDHPFWSVTDQKFERADELDSGEEVLGANEQALTIGALKIETHRETLAYNLSVEGIHTYHVGTNETLVHNVCPIADGTTGASFIADSKGTIIPTSRSMLENGFRKAGFTSESMRSAGMGYTLPDGSIVRIMAPTNYAPWRASFTNSNHGPISPFTGKPPQRPRIFDKGAWKDKIKELTHVGLGS